MVYVISHLPFFLWAGACFCSLVAHVFPWGQINNKKRCYHTTTWGAPFRTFIIAECLLNTELILPSEELALA